MPSGNPDEASTGLVRSVIIARAKPLNKLRPDEIGRLVVQRDGFPFLLDLVMPILIDDPLFEGGYYPGDILSNLIRSPESIWAGRAYWQSKIPELYRRAMSMPEEDIDAFRESLDLPATGLAN